MHGVVGDDDDDTCGRPTTESRHEGSLEGASGKRCGPRPLSKCTCGLEQQGATPVDANPTVDAPLGPPSPASQLPGRKAGLLHTFYEPEPSCAKRGRYILVLVLLQQQPWASSAYYSITSAAFMPAGSGDRGMAFHASHSAGLDPGVASGSDIVVMGRAGPPSLSHITADLSVKPDKRTQMRRAPSLKCSGLSSPTRVSGGRDFIVRPPRARPVTAPGPKFWWRAAPLPASLGRGGQRLIEVFNEARAPIRSVKGGVMALLPPTALATAALSRRDALPPASGDRARCNSEPGSGPWTAAFRGVAGRAAAVVARGSLDHTN
ncbi:hypothetical protein PHYSODRAFT_328476 [Phytophthora sojae]|uniref:Uncharacterized protein n=1 Tax=Phytophthora sojae (strain P6497) TaxID=1094619 RepID=G4Z7F4_PHYSP|nr:hypothetical protein PHYSODRAFT_328476 [Phytophthora sojae]EGZ20357.1 hypothetical protein PHYSODRAFT_328476 [Phytophthora sojae]|eukprot:XP_009523074.1 hypothetical protein PHYSODRAFT_328476 [Phytophthora sojae]